MRIPFAKAYPSDHPFGMPGGIAAAATPARAAIKTIVQASFCIGMRIPPYDVESHYNQVLVPVPGGVSAASAGDAAVANQAGGFAGGHFEMVPFETQAQRVVIDVGDQVQVPQKLVGGDPFAHGAGQQVERAVRTPAVTAVQAHRESEVLEVVFHT